MVGRVPVARAVRRRPSSQSGRHREGVRLFVLGHLGQATPRLPRLVSGAPHGDSLAQIPSCGHRRFGEPAVGASDRARRQLVTRPLAVVGLAVALAVLLGACSSSPSNQSGPEAVADIASSPSPSSAGARLARSRLHPLLAAGHGARDDQRDADGDGHLREPRGGGHVELPLLRPAGLDGLRPLLRATARDERAPHVRRRPGRAPGSLVPGRRPALANDVGPATQPWAMQLANGQACIFVSAAWSTGLGPFACPSAAGSSPSEADCHPPRKSGIGFEASCQTSETASSTFRSVQVVKVWT